MLLFLNTGGGHGSTARAVAEAVEDLYGDRVHADLVDVTKEYFPWPLSKLDAVYDRLVRLNGWPWAMTYHLTDGPRRVTLLRPGWCALTAGSIRRLLDEHRADVIVCCHPLLKAPISRVLTAGAPETQMITLVTDLTSAHASWFVPGDGRCLVATERARQRALACGLPDTSVQIIGLPIRRCFARASRESPASARNGLELNPTVPVVLIVGGANGVGPLFQLVKAIAGSGVRAQLVVITGHNGRLRERLASHRWSLPVRTEGFVGNMHRWMRAADLLVTKAGPSTISEAFTMGLPMVLVGALPGQERENVDHLVEGGAGVWAPGPKKAAQAVFDLLETDHYSLLEMAKRAKAMAQPDAAGRAARIIWECASEALA